jgi:hypothetical protein
MSQKTHKFQCDRCGGIFHDHQKAVEWTGAVVCRGSGTRGCWESRHPQDFVRSLSEDQTAPNARSRNVVGIYEKTPSDYVGYVVDHTDYIDESDMVSDRYVRPS